jgi:hypothetical protein
MLSRELLRGELATRDPRGAAAPRTDTVVSREERGHHNSNQRAHSEGELSANRSKQLNEFPRRRAKPTTKRGKTPCNGVAGPTLQNWRPWGLHRFNFEYGEVGGVTAMLLPQRHGGKHCEVGPAAVHSRAARETGESPRWPAQAVG